VDIVWEGPCEITAEQYCRVRMDGSEMNVTLRVFEVPAGATVEPLAVRFAGTGGGRVVSTPEGSIARPVARPPSGPARASC